MDLDLKNKRVLVFGSASGIGSAIAQAFETEGARVFRIDRDAQKQDDSAIVDITNYASVKKLTDEVGNEWQGIDHVVCSAAIGSGKFGFPFWNLEPEDWQSVLDVTLKGSVHVAHAAQPWLCRSESEAIAHHKSLLLFTSVAGQIGSQTDPPYSAAKAGVINFTQCAAKDLAPYSVRVNALSPGMVKTPLNESVWASSQEGKPSADLQKYAAWAGEKIRSIAPLGRWQELEEFGAMAVYLASPFARNITGQTINIDGGQVMHS